MWGCSGWPAATPSSSLGAAGAGALATTTASSAAARSRVSQACTARTATGHELLTAGSAPMSGRRCPPRGRRDGRRVGRCRLPSVVGKPCLPTKRERACDQRPVPADGPIRANLEVGPTELTLDLLVALLDPVTQPIQPHRLGQVGPLARRLAGRARWSADTVCCARAAGRVGGGHHQPQPPIWTPAGRSGVGCPPGVGVPSRKRRWMRRHWSGFLGPCQPSSPAASTGVWAASAGAQMLLGGLRASMNRTLAAPRASVKPGLSP